MGKSMSRRDVPRVTRWYDGTEEEATERWKAELEDSIGGAIILKEAKAQIRQKVTELREELRRGYDPVIPV